MPLAGSAASQVFGPSSDHRCGSAAVQRRPDRQAAGDEFGVAVAVQAGAGRGADTRQGIPGGHLASDLSESREWERETSMPALRPRLRRI